MKKVHGALSFCTKRQQHAVGALRSQSFYQQIESVFLIPFLSFILKQGMLHLFYASSCRNTLVNKVHCIQKQSLIMHPILDFIQLQGVCFRAGFLITTEQAVLQVPKFPKCTLNCSTFSPLFFLPLLYSCLFVCCF